MNLARGREGGLQKIQEALHATSMTSWLQHCSLGERESGLKHRLSRSNSYEIARTVVVEGCGSAKQTSTAFVRNLQKFFKLRVAYKYCNCA